MWKSEMKSISVINDLNLYFIIIFTIIITMFD